MRFNYSIKKVNLIDVIFVISMAIACTRDFGDYHAGFYHQIGIAFVWIVFACVRVYKNQHSYSSEYLTDVFRFLLLYLFPQVLMYLYSLLLVVFGVSEWRFLGTNLTSFIPIAFSVICFVLFKDKAYKYICYSIFLSWIISIVSATIRNGFVIFKQAVIQGYFDHYYKVPYLAKDNYFEIHDIVLSLGYFIVFYIFAYRLFNKKDKSWNNLFLVIFLVISLLGIKRIAVLGVIIAFVFYLLFNRLGNKRKQICIFAGWFGLIVCLAFVGVIRSGNWFFDVIEKIGINTAGRVRYFKAVLDLTEFSPFYFGLGRGAVNRILTSELSYLGVAGVHSDIIKLYVENGFVLFCFWLWYYLIFIPHYYSKRFNIQSMVIYFAIAIYMFVLYLTDNTDTYFACQLLFTIIPIQFALDSKYANHQLSIS